MGELTYKDFIDNIIKTRGRFSCGEEYHERHHIVPKCMGGTNSEGNLIDLFAREHFIAHKLLANENPDNLSLVRAYSMMAFPKTNVHKRYELSPEEYEEARKAVSIALKGKSLSEEAKNKLREYAIQRWSSEEARKEISERQMGENNSFYGKHHTDETREKMSKAQSGKNHNGCRAVYCYELDEYFWGAKEAEQKYGINHAYIAQCCLGKRKSCGKHPITGEKLHWVYVDEMNNSSVA